MSSPDPKTTLDQAPAEAPRPIAAEFFRQVLEAIPHPFYVIDANNHAVLLANSTALGPTGQVGVSCFSMIHHSDHPCDREASHICTLAQVQATRHPVMVEHVHSGPDGDRHYEVHGFPIFDQDGRVAQMIEYSLDITERRRSETAAGNLLKTIEQAKQEWEQTLDCIGDLIYVVDEAGLIQRCNKAAVDFFQLGFRDILGQNLTELCAANGLRLPADLEAREIQQIPSGRWFNIKHYQPGQRQAAPASSRFYQVVTFHEITLIKAISAELESKNREIDRDRLKLQEALDAHSLLIREVTKQEDFSLRFQNPELVCCYELKGCTATNCPCHGQPATRCWTSVGTLCRGKKQGTYANKIDSCTQCEVYKAATLDTNLLLGEQFNVMMDMLENKNRELQKAYEQLKASQSQVLQQEKMASIGQLAAGVAHEINNPMGFISSNLGTLDKYLGRLSEFIRIQSEALDKPETSAQVAEARKKLKIDYVMEDSRDLIKESLDGADRVKKIVQNLKSFSRIDNAEEQPADLNECLDTTLNIIWNELKYKTTVNKEYGDLPKIRCLPQQLNQVFMNLLVNAAQAIAKQGQITIRTWEEQGTLRVAISDSGCGIPADKLQRIFEPFFTTKPVGKGTGLGLSICYDIIKKHGGEIKVESREGSGTTFTVVLPIKVDGLTNDD